MIVWLDDSTVDPAWIRQNLVEFKDCTACEASDISNAMRRGFRVRDGATLRLKLELSTADSHSNDGSKSHSNDDEQASSFTTLVVKQTVTPELLELSQRLGLSREALFYKHFASQITPRNDTTTTTTTRRRRRILPRIYYSEGNLVTGSKTIIMEDLKSGIDSGVLFGPGNPNNWTRDVADMARRAGNPDPSDVARITFEQMARIHALYWKRSDFLIQHSWLRGCDWIQGTDQGKASWEATQGLLRHFWNDYLQAEQQQQLQQPSGSSSSSSSSSSRISWNPNVRASVEKALSGISWEAQRKRLNLSDRDCHFTLVHGDFWPGNVLWMAGNNQHDIHHNVQTDDEERSNSTADIVFVDWEMVGIGSGPQELGQYVISNMDRHVRRVSEEFLVRIYYNTLLDELSKNKNSNAKDDDDDDDDDYYFSILSWEECWREYTVGGVERWLWFLIYFCGQTKKDHNSQLSVSWAQFFHNQIADFMEDHNLTAADISQPRP